MLRSVRPLGVAPEVGNAPLSGMKIAFLRVDGYNRTMVESLNRQQKLAVAEYLAGMPETAIAFIFGSYARGQARPDSDVDIAVLLADHVGVDEYLRARLRLMDGISRLLERDDVDLVILNEAPLALAYRVLQDGEILFCRERALYVQYRVRTLNFYFDFAPFLERYEEAFLHHVSQEGLLYGQNPYRGTAEAHKKILAAPGRTARDDPGGVCRQLPDILGEGTPGTKGRSALSRRIRPLCVDVRRARQIIGARSDRCVQYR